MKKGVFKVLTNITAILLAIFMVGNDIMMSNTAAINAFLGATTTKTVKDPNSSQVPKLFYDSDYKTYEDLNDVTRDLSIKVMAEGMVLLKNDNNVLPLDKGASINLYGAGSYNFVYFGNGSSAYDLQGYDNYASCTTLKQGLENGGDFVVNAGLWDFYKTHTEYWQAVNFSGNRKQTTKYAVKDAKWDQITTADKEKQADAGIMVISRNSGENADRDLSYAELAASERDVLAGMKKLKDAGKLGSIILLLNSANPIELDVAYDSALGIDAVLWCGLPGAYGADAIGQILSGAVAPSGRLSDTYWMDNALNPVYTNIGGANEFANSSILTPFAAGQNLKYVVYQEGIYNGYRYTETRYEDFVMGRPGVGDYNYAKTVAFPFGYGLSYTEFEYSDMKVTPSITTTAGKYEVKVTVKNVGKVAAKEVVQVYLQKPYTQYDIDNQIEKASVELIGFAKTATLKPGETETVTIEVDEKFFASYDAHNERTYILDAGNYYLTVAKNAHDAINNILEVKADAQKSKMTAAGNKDLVYNCTEATGKYDKLDAVKYSTNDHIRKQNANFEPQYPGQQPNYGIDKITNQFDDTDFQLYEGIKAEEKDQPYITRSDWQGTAFHKVTLTATDILADDQRSIDSTGKDMWIQKDNIPYPTFGKANGLSLINLREYEDGSLIEYDSPLWNDLLDQITWDEMIPLLQNGLRQTNQVPSINAPQTYQYNGATGPVPEKLFYGNSNPNENALFRSFSNYYQSGENEVVPTLPCNVVVASTFNVDLIEEFGEQVGEECGWAGMSGIYGLGVNVHRGALCGRTFEYYSEDPFLVGMATAYEAKGMQSKGVFVILKHLVLNDQEDQRHGICSWANEQTIREIYLRPADIAIEYGDEMGMLGMMTGLNRLGAKWTGAQGFCATVMRAELGMNGYIISDYFKNYMDPILGVLNGNDLIDGDCIDKSGGDGKVYNFNDYKEGYGAVAWAMRESAHRILYTIVRSNAMNLMTNDMKVIPVTPGWQIAVKAVTITSYVLFGASVAGYIYCYIQEKRKANQK